MIEKMVIKKWYLLLLCVIIILDIGNYITSIYSIHALKDVTKYFVIFRSFYLILLIMVILQLIKKNYATRSLVLFYLVIKFLMLLYIINAAYQIIPLRSKYVYHMDLYRWLKFILYAFMLILFRRSTTKKIQETRASDYSILDIEV
jgi:hypothetical protein